MVIERIVLYGASAWAKRITSRQKRQLSSIQRRFLLNITGAYSTTSTAALQVIEGIMPLPIKAEMESVLLRYKGVEIRKKGELGRMKQKAKWFFGRNQERK
ncbi:hypothetical protein AVEN_29270-1 [Araneus ventricosus]|uniref:Uncharacterized protein n=1 Tax=Araneus ventricosus TaxID=182803 RepID=A0A4Y2I810_ARAVE|nr:hypothetical protein AVEN_29270-1 [Araneus ventricosus]